jgi:phosphoribosyl 1,2-cyclic phosphate phosphodiesterase
LNITFLGTGTSQGVPVIGCPCAVCRSLDFRDKRLRTSLHIEAGNHSYVVDTGPDFRHQMLRENISRLDAVIYTHAHRDHTAGLDDVRAYNYLQQMAIPIYGSAATLDQLKTDFSYIFHKDTYPGIPQITLNEIDERPFSINGLEILPLPVMHFKMPVLGFRFQNFSYITDANFISEDTIKRLEGTEILVLNALQKDRHISHFNLEEALKKVDLIKPAKTFFTHISHRLGLHRQVTEELPPNVSLAFDGLRLEM